MPMIVKGAPRKLRVVFWLRSTSYPSGQRSDCADRIDPVVVVAEHGEGGCGESAHELAHQSHAALLAREVVARQHHQIGLEGVRHRDGIADSLRWRARPDVDVRELGHPQTVVRRVEVVNHEDPMLGLGHL